MKITDGIHWNIYDVLAYQRNFNFINSIRDIGKTYTTELYVIDQCIKKGVEFIYIVRTKDEKKDGALAKGLEKVLMRFEGEKAVTTDELLIDNVPIGYCYALSEYRKLKKRSFPNVKYFIFDEYMLEGEHTNEYVHGWKEPDILLNMYHTVDRDEDRVIVFLLGNNTRFYNPYHIHPAFHIPKIEPGKIWTSENVLYQVVAPTDKLIEKNKSKFSRMIENTEYGEYAKEGKFVYEQDNFVEQINGNCRYAFTCEYDGITFGIWRNMKEGKVYISDKFDKGFPIRYALTLKDHTENTMLTLAKKPAHLKWLVDNFKLGNVRFCSMEIKARFEGALRFLL